MAYDVILSVPCLFRDVWISKDDYKVYATTTFTLENWKKQRRTIGKAAEIIRLPVLTRILSSNRHAGITDSVVACCGTVRRWAGITKCTERLSISNCAAKRLQRSQHSRLFHKVLRHGLDTFFS